MSPTTNPGASTGQPKPNTNAKGNLPTGQLELATLAVNAAKGWQASQLGDLLWKTKADFAAEAAAYMASLGTADEADDQRSPQARRLRELDKEINKSLGHVKGYLAEDHEGDADEAFYDEFGIDKEGKNHQLPSARPARAKALAKLLKAIDGHGYNGRKFGKAYWTPIEAEYSKLVEKRVKTEGDASGEVGKKNVQEKPLRKALKALIKLVQAHYPDTYASVLREFGFQKESY